MNKKIIKKVSSLFILLSIIFSISLSYISNAEGGLDLSHIRANTLRSRIDLFCNYEHAPLPGEAVLADYEDAFKGKGYEKIALTTFGFQAPEFYKKLGYEVEFIREDKDPKLNKYFYIKKI